MTEIMNIEQRMNGMVSSMPTMTRDKVALISKRMVEVDRANKTLGRSNTQTTNQLGTLTMLTDSPYRRLRQCLAQIEKKRLALEDHYYRYERKKVDIKKWQEIVDNDELDWYQRDMARINILEAEHYQERGSMYIEGALKEIAVFQTAYQDIMEAHNIPPDYGEREIEEDEIRHGIRQAFIQSHRDMCHNGRITAGNAEYLSNYGIHLQTAQYVLMGYMKSCDEMVSKNGEMPTIEHLYLFLDEMVEKFYDAHKLVMNHIGLKSVIRDDYLYLEAEKDGDN